MAIASADSIIESLSSKLKYVLLTELVFVIWEVILLDIWIFNHSQLKS